MKSKLLLITSTKDLASYSYPTMTIVVMNNKTKKKRRKRSTVFAREKDSAPEKDCAPPVATKDAIAAPKKDDAPSVAAKGPPTVEEHVETGNAPKGSVLLANPSQNEVWERNYQQYYKFYQVHKHLTLPKSHPNYVRLSKWLTNQRHHRKAMKPDRLRKLQEINYAATPKPREDHERNWD
ncbi:unnamed protein product [Cylindrotheca closterium]|uniref:Helicase-associated domain-containing protein n=1 Tax=Cylindrotheca closterium TaxID=2856 RepID=A0AAD2JH70_9STRA|nr:unnamed protein product [Cylindrotheca closterium]